MGAAPGSAARLLAVAVAAAGITDLARSQRLEIRGRSGSPTSACEFRRDGEGNPVYWGEFQDFHDNGALRRQGRLEANRREGLWREHHTNGETVLVRGSYKGDLRDTRVWQERDAQGNLLAEGSYDRGHRKGRWRSFLEPDVLDPAESGEYDRSLERATEGPFAGAHREGPTLDGARHGWWRFTWPNGRLMAEGRYARGRRVGSWRFWHPDGTFDPHFVSGEYEGVRRDLAAPSWRPQPGEYLPRRIHRAQLLEAAGVLELREETAEVAAQVEARQGPGATDPPDHEAYRHAVLRRLLALDLSVGAERATALELLALMDDLGARVEPAPLPLGERGADGISLRILRWISLLANVHSRELFWRFEHQVEAEAIELATGDPALDWAARVHPAQLQPPLHVHLEPMKAPAARRQRRQNIEDVLDAGSAWLVAHQAQDGRWSASEFMERCPAGSPCGGPGIAAHDVGVTGLALLALVRSGSDLSRGPHAASVRRGVLWLFQQQDPETGRLGEWIAGLPRTLPVEFDEDGDLRRSRGDPGEPFERHVFDHAIASLALAEVLALHDSPALQRCTERAIARIHDARNLYGGWRYDVPPVGDNDMAVTAWMVQALAAARDAGLVVEDQAFQDAATLVAEFTDAGSGRVGYSWNGQYSARIPGFNVAARVDHSEPMTAAGLLVSLLAGAEPDPDSVTLVRGKTPEIGRGWLRDHYSWYHGAAALARIDTRRNSPWLIRLRKAVVSTQQLPGHEAGSWAPEGPWGGVGGRVYSTAMCMLALIEAG